MKIVVCDDSMVDLEKIRGLLTIYKERHKAIQLETEYFTDSAKLYRWIQAGAQGDIYGLASAHGHHNLCVIIIFQGHAPL